MTSRSRVGLKSVVTSESDVDVLSKSTSSKPANDVDSPSVVDKDDIVVRVGVVVPLSSFFSEEEKVKHRNQILN